VLYYLSHTCIQVVSSLTGFQILKITVLPDGFILCGLVHILSHPYRLWKVEYVK
jgi:hypothetical protein